MRNLLIPAIVGLAPVLLAQDRSTPYTDAAQKAFNTTSYTAPNGVTTVYDHTPRFGDDGSKKSGPGISKIVPEVWPSDSNSLEAKSLPFDGGFAGYTEDGNDFVEANGRRVFAFKVKPGEKMEFNIKSQDDKIALRTFIPTPPPTLKWKMDLRYANVPVRARRSKHLEVKNSSAEEQTLYLVLYGVVNYPFRIELQRSGSKQG
jgi:hypothetical protein